MNYAPRDARNSNIALERENPNERGNHVSLEKKLDVICMPLCYIECNVRWLLDCIYFQ